MAAGYAKSGTSEKKYRTEAPHNMAQRVRRTLQPYLKTSATHGLATSYKQILEMQSQPVSRFTCRGQLVYANRAYRRLLGLSLAKLRDYTIFDFVPVTERLALRKHLASLNRKRPAGLFENFVCGPRGLKRRILWHNRAIFDSRGELLGYQSSGWDVTWLREVEQALREREALYRSFEENLNVGVFRTSRDGTIVHANKAHAQLFGFRHAKTLIGKNVLQFYVNPSRRRELLRKIQREKVVRDFLIPLRRIDGSTFLGMVTARGHFSKSGRLEWLDGIVDDVTQQQRDREALALLEFSIENAADAVVWVDVSGRFVRVNRAACELSGYTRKELLRKKVADLDVGVAPKQHVHFWRILRKKKSARWETVVRRKDGTLVPVEVHANHVYFGGQELNCAFVRDVTERKRLEEERRRFSIRLMRVQERERQRISQTLHDHLGQLLTLARLEASSLSVNTPEAEQALKRLQERLDAVLRTLRDLVASLQPSVLEDLGLKAALEALAQDVGRTVGMAIEVRCTGPVQRLSKEQSLCIYRVVQEALTNVIRHARATRAWVHLRVGRHVARVSVEDNGRGLSAASWNQGLGVASMRERLEALGGRLQMDERKQGGTRVEGMVPLERR